jgi:hypothetical protein
MVLTIINIKYHEKNSWFAAADGSSDRSIE